MSNRRPKTKKTVLDILQVTTAEVTDRRAQLDASPASRVEMDRELCESYEKILCCSFALNRDNCMPKCWNQRNGDIGSKQEVEDKLRALRTLVVKSGLPKSQFYCSESEDTSNMAPSLRACVWKILLGALVVNVPSYISLIKLGPCSQDVKIRDDTFRTYKNNTKFWNAVDESQLTRVLTATARVIANNPNESKNYRDNIGYVQGMNVLVAPLLFVMPTELDAFTCFTALLTKHCPRYILSNLEGVHTGCALAEGCLKALDPELYYHLAHTFATQLHMEIFMLQYVLTFFANMNQLDEVLIVWDSLLALGVHFNCVLVATHIILQRKILLKEKSAFRIQSEILNAPLDGELLVKCATKLLCFIPIPLRHVMLLHPVEPVSSYNMGSIFEMKPGSLRKSRSSSNLSGNNSSRDTDANHDSRISYLSVSKMSLLSKKDSYDKKNSVKQSFISPRPAPLNARKSPSKMNAGGSNNSLTSSRILNPNLRSGSSSMSNERIVYAAPGNVQPQKISRPRSAPIMREPAPCCRPPSPPSNRGCSQSRRTSTVENSRPEWVRSLRLSSCRTATKKSQHPAKQNNLSRRRNVRHLDDNAPAVGPCFSEAPNNRSRSLSKSIVQNPVWK